MKSFFPFVFLFLSHFSFSQNVGEQIKLRLEGVQETGKLELRGRGIREVEFIKDFYSKRSFEPLWINDGDLSELAYELRYEIGQARYDGLNSLDYHLFLIQAFFESIEANKKSGFEVPEEDLADLELFLSDAVIQFALHLDQGRINPRTLKQSWNIPKKVSTFDPLIFLNKVEKSQELRPFLIELYPEFPIYTKGREVIRDLEEKMDQADFDWSELRSNKSLKVGDSHSLIPEIRRRLAFWDYWKGEDLDNKEYDSLLLESVLNYQEDKGLAVDGVLGKNTFAALNQSPQNLISQIAVNLERLRWLDDSKMKSKSILVNIPGYELVFWDKGETVFSSKVIVGEYKNQTPVFQASMSHLIFSPYWNVPESIVYKELIPSIRRNPNYLARNNMEVLSYSGKKVDPSTVNWKARSIPYLIRQNPGPSNSLGLVKFMFPNPYNVYIHDTPAKHLFDRENRSLSHGCIRLARPLDFAKFLLKDQEEWTEEKIKEAMSQDHEVRVELTTAIPVYVLYMTLWEDEFGNPQFRRDIYGRDPELLSRLGK
ncbi:MAG: L,D-transpeptidase family protein [Algoriphagus sp.]|uniref:L,D-transpeptidase family protein n=1 Tax=Algoriphagus sp. TaxID=1872435 RepID=UPI0017C664DF|nr:L,D-transpeptidase family protein [Algoriphagus sp.]NVJ85723.1 L,D-transpeptidase family protein [Algoriphagus sp.]